MVRLFKFKLIKTTFKKLKIAAPTFHQDEMSKIRTMQMPPRDDGQDKAEKGASF